MKMATEKSSTARVKVDNERIQRQRSLFLETKNTIDNERLYFME
ncbi:MAG TPA: hypothetical protein VM118_04695 [Acidobacteriota bacterium]|nr:hypothetical protein [Acidobacteriota bacterium]